MRRSDALLVAFSLAAALPLWLCPFPPLTDYPQHLAMASIVRHHADPAWGFSAYRLALWHPNSLFEILVAWIPLVSIDVAGKLVLSLAIAAVGPAAARLARRARAPDCAAYLALAFVWNVSLWYGFVGTVLAAPLLLAGVAWADEVLECGEPRDDLRLALLGIALYLTHLQFLFVFAGCVGWLALARRIPLLRIARALAPLAPALLAGVVFVALRSHASHWEAALAAAPPGFVPPPVRLLVLPVLLFGGPAGTPLESVPAALAAIAAVSALAFRERAAERRFLTLAAWLGALFLFMPTNFVGQNVFQRMAPLAAMFAAAALPFPKPSRAKVLAVLCAAACVAEIALASSIMRKAAADGDGLAELFERAGRASRFAALMPDAKSTALRYPEAPLIHFGAYYQAEWGGTQLVSFAAISHSAVQLEERESLLEHPGDPVPIAWSWDRHAPLFDAVLIRGSTADVEKIIGPGHTVETRGRWHLLRLR